MSNAITKIVHLDSSRKVSIDVPPEMGDSVELILIPCSGELKKTHDGHERLSNDEIFLVSAYSAVVEEDSEEDKIWQRYIK